MEEDPVDRVMVPLLERPSEEWEALVEQACRDHPELAEQLHERWAALRAMGLDGTPVTDADGFPERLGDFRLIERLGAGGMGVVYRAEQVSLGREVALKLMRPENLYFPKARERFRREVEAVAGLVHPGIVPVHFVGEEEGVPFFAMELLGGPTLADVLERLAGRSPETLSGADLAEAAGLPEGERSSGVFALSWTDACAELARQVAEALEHAHARGLVHRDVKPSNIALTRDGRAQLFDFGLVVTGEVDRLTQTGGQLGTLQYMAPEQLRGERELDARADVYALGVTLYELVTLTAPYTGDSRNEVEASVLGGTPPPLRSLNRRAPPELELVCAKAMDLDRARRYASARAMQDELERVLERRPVQARPASTILRTRRWAQRHPALAVGVLAAIGLFGVAPSVLLWRERQHSDALTISLDKESKALAAEREALAAEQEALAEATASFTFLEDLFIEIDPYLSGNPDARVRDVLARGMTALDNLEGSLRLRGRLALSLAWLHKAHALFAEALPLAEEALAIEELLGAPLEANRYRPLDVVVSCLRMLERSAEAETLLIAELEGAGDPQRRADLHFLLGRTRLDFGRLEESLEQFELARGYFADSGVEDPERQLATASLVSSVLSRLGRNERALAFAEEALAIAEKTYEPGHPAIADALSRCAFPLMALGQQDQAIRMQSEAVEATASYYGRDHFAMWRHQSDLANLLGMAESYGEAALAADEVVKLCVVLFGEGDPRTVEARRVHSACKARAAFSEGR